jgi:hypothetical protein
MNTSEGAAPQIKLLSTVRGRCQLVPRSSWRGRRESWRASSDEPEDDDATSTRPGECSHVQVTGSREARVSRARCVKTLAATSSAAPRRVTRLRSQVAPSRARS